MKSKKLINRIIPPLIVAVIALVLALVQPFTSLDNMMTDNLYSRLRQPDRNIMIIAIDEDTLNEYGTFTSWSRDKTADLLNYLYSDPENAPAVVGLDITFLGETGTDADQKLAQAASGDKDIVVSGALVFQGTAEATPDKMTYNAYHVADVEYPYPALNQNVKTGFANAFNGSDGINRYNMTTVNFNGQPVNSFAKLIADIYCQKNGLSYDEPQTDNAGRFRFFYAGKSEEFQHVSMNQVVTGNIPPSEFKDKIVLVGAYASGMQDAYRGTADVGGIVYGVEIQANIIQALMEGATANSADKTTYAVILALAALVLFLIGDRLKLFLAVLLPAAGIAANLAAGKALAAKGILIPQLYAVVVLVLAIAYFIVKKYLTEAQQRRQIVKTFGKYMEPRLVEQLAKDNAIETNLGGTKRDVAVLFVDIRGFTSMSEVLEPEQVVEILNAYLGHVTECIFKHKGMLDKFIGDAAMAVFNAPADQEDYKYEAVAAAWDIAQGSKALEEDLMNRFGRSVSYGIGVNCGPAVIGNIGCDFRMDYTAIGDTVNTAARLESNAPRGEILISDKLKKELEGRIIVEEAGAMTFKGKSEPMDVYRVVGLK